MPFSEAFGHFQTFFKSRVGKNWDMRLEKVEGLPDDKFVYTPPVLGRPVGLLPKGYVRSEERETEIVAYDTDSEVGSEDEESGTEEESSDEDMANRRSSKMVTSFSKGWGGQKVL
jgi:hypothetical protein